MPISQKRELEVERELAIVMRELGRMKHSRTKSRNERFNSRGHRRFYSILISRSARDGPTDRWL